MMHDPIGQPKPTLLIVDDEPLNLQVLKQVLQKDYRLLFARDGERAITLAQSERPNLILLDIMMPGLTGIETCQALKADPRTARIPVIFVTALSEEASGSEGFAVGAVDYITKPINAALVQARVKTHLSLVQLDELQESRLEIINSLGRAAEYKDNETGMHVMRMSYYARALAEAAGLDKHFCDQLQLASPMHDVGKIGIPEAILLKPGKLTPEERAVIEEHPRIGAEIIGEHPQSALMTLARELALYHHEKWDGTGYPHGLQGENIPLGARIIAIADVFDALTSERPYKTAWSIDDAIGYIVTNGGTHFDPNLAVLMPKIKEKLGHIRDNYLLEHQPVPDRLIS